ncbi:auxin-induced protein PCNT115 [Umbelopsis sp. PMI_123]|nr:auxin-induced protein PCNT115 [Umbelopsis sp. PMI_123]
MALPTQVLQREIGKSGVKFPAIGLGCLSLVSHFGRTDDESSIKLLKKALDIAIYGVGHSEKIISHVIKDRRKDVFLATKFGVYVQNVFKACEGSLNRLGTDYMVFTIIIGAIEATVGAMAELVKQGKVRYLGISECSAQTLRRAHKVHPITAVQMEYSPWTLSHEKDDLIKACRELGVSIVAYSPLGKGFLTGQIRKFADLEENDWRPDKIKDIADKKGVLSSQLALAWDLAQGDDMFVIPGTRKEKNLLDNFAANNVKLTEDEKQSIRIIAESFKVAGERYVPAQLAMVGL